MLTARTPARTERKILARRRERPAISIGISGNAGELGNIKAVLRSYGCLTQPGCPIPGPNQVDSCHAAVQRILSSYCLATTFPRSRGSFARDLPDAIRKDCRRQAWHDGKSVLLYDVAVRLSGLTIRNMPVSYSCSLFLISRQIEGMQPR